MVGVHTTNDPKLDESQLENDVQLKSSTEQLVTDTTDAPLKHTIIIPNLGMSGEKKSNQCFALAYNQIDCNGQNLKSGNAVDDTKIDKGKDKASGGDGSLSSGCSIVTISSVATSEPDPASPNGQNSLGRCRSVLDERWQHTALQVSVPFFIAGVGTIGAGLVLGTVEKWEVFSKVSQLFILVPSLLGLKGNLDMCLASRLCTQANLGNMSSFREIAKMVIGNLALVQIQAIVAAIIVSIFASAAHAAMNGVFIWDHALLVTASSLCTATSSCFLLDLVMIAVILAAHRWKMNPDNLATPLAASFGDVVSVSVLSIIASNLFIRLQAEVWVVYVIISGYLLILPIWIFIVLRNKYTRNILTSGWVPVLSALFISGLGGLILSQAVDVLSGFVIFQPIINGIGGNLVSVQASRISTTLHQTSIMGIIPPYTKVFISPFKALVKGVPFAHTARLLIIMGIVGEVVFIFAADYIEQHHSTLHVYFVLSYIIVAFLQIMLLLYVAHIIIHAMWRFKIDPDNSAIPYLTALGDLTGTMFLGGAFWFLKEIGYPYAFNVKT
ncbi:solute carrier family 41 member 1 [Fopius arisanus]|uniref:Solute carrier family 41 member 1 n=2 Tax=Fopius arisanus TaxID=64838 RepID=A0A9R1T4H7_9HYME|nr:PREDICTED: solute carrier family 41 member 1-like [Fopius arisanus]XP_011302543.1 PREDICTED: solute carrier family 41 member 1-like [Fopius arisanus]XP_011302544.1 PREDICTED: solute carrier family 41 member 1-like [Fopius arisanus]